jgi:hypothetical protein
MQCPTCYRIRMPRQNDGEYLTCFHCESIHSKEAWENEKGPQLGMGDGEGSPIPRALERVMPERFDFQPLIGKKIRAVKIRKWWECKSDDLDTMVIEFEDDTVLRLHAHYDSNYMDGMMSAELHPKNKYPEDMDDFDQVFQNDQS